MRDEYQVTLKTRATGLRLISLETLPEGPDQHPGRFSNGNGVISGVTAEAVSVADPLKRAPIHLAWGWADTTQQDVDSSIANLFGPDSDPSRGWALAAHQKPGGRVAVLLAEEPFGFEGGTLVRISIQQASVYQGHNVARLRLGLGTIGDAGLAMLPTAAARWYLVGPFPEEADHPIFDATYGPEDGDLLDHKKNFGFGNQYWRFDTSLVDGRPVPLAEGRNVSYVGKYLYSPTARDVDVSLGSDDGFRLFVNGKEVAQHNIERGVKPDQDKATLPLKAGRNLIVMKIVNTGGAAGYYFKPAETAELDGDLVAAILDPHARDSALADRLEVAWRTAFLPSYKENAAKIASLDKDKADLDTRLPRTMVMKELDAPRETFVLTRGQYDKPDKKRPVSRGIPAALGHLPEGAPANRLGLAEWLTSSDNPLTARVTVNRLWELCFGTGLVRTSEDFGFQGEWPSHPELLDWLAVEFRDQNWDVEHILRLIVTSQTYRQSSRYRPELAESDPEDRLLAYFPRRRLSAEQIRDSALFVSGLLVEKLGGPSVKPYQPDGLWQEVAMIQSNTREYKRGMADELYRRSLYTYWKRACPPPSLLTFDAPTREFCTIRRNVTDTPLQALVLWNDEQFVEAARVLAQRTLTESAPVPSTAGSATAGAPAADPSPGSASSVTDNERLTRMFRRCTGHDPDARELAALSGALADFRARFTAAPADADGLLKKGEAPVTPTLDRAELAAWTMIASGLFDLYQTTTQE
jgi:hypothetical protein